jgi:outer membrane biosynthesis protein TonB
MHAIHTSNFLKHAVDINPAFDAENVKKNRQHKLNSALITILFYAGLLAILYFVFTLTPPFPPLSDQGVFLNIGISETGSGEIQPQGNADELVVPTPVASGQVAQPKSNDVLTQETEEDVPVIPKKEIPKKTTKPATTSTAKPATNTPTPTPPKPKPKALYPGGSANNSTGEGKTGGSGDQGKPNGNPFGDSYDGNPGMGGPGKGGNGGNAQLGMSGRKIIYLPSIIDNSQKTGKVVVNIKVDKEGNVTFAKATQKGSTTTDTYLYQLAEDAAMKTRVNADSGAAEEQFGTITYTFRVK